MTSIAVVIPLARPDRLRGVLESLRASEREVKLWPFPVASHGDEAALDACLACEESFGVSPTSLGPGDFAAKIAVGYEATEDEWIFQAADDVTFEPGWAEAAIEVAERRGALVVGTNDESNPLVKRGGHSTHSLIARSYIDDPGASADGPRSVFSLAYAHNWCDNELVELAKARGVWAFSRGSVVRHHHPLWKGRPEDAVDEIGMAGYVRDAETFRARRKLWTGRNSPRLAAR